MCGDKHEGLAAPRSCVATHRSLDCRALLDLWAPRRKTSLLFANDKSGLRASDLGLYRMRFSLFKCIVQSRWEPSFFRSPFPRSLTWQRKASPMTTQRRWTSVLPVGHCFSTWDQRPARLGKWQGPGSVFQDTYVWENWWANMRRWRRVESIITADGCTVSRNQNDKKKYGQKHHQSSTQMSSSGRTQWLAA